MPCRFEVSDTLILPVPVLELIASSVFPLFFICSSVLAFVFIPCLGDLVCWSLCLRTVSIAKKLGL